MCTRCASAGDAWRGHAVAERDGVWVYIDTGEPVASLPDRACGHCGEANTPEGHDGCLGTLSCPIRGVMNACCGHGHSRDAYVQFWDGSRLAGAEALAWAKASDGAEET